MTDRKKNGTSGCTSHFCVIDHRVVASGVAVLAAVCLADWEFLPFKKDKCRIHVIRKETDIDFGRNELHRYIVADPVNGDRGIFADFE